MEDAIIPTARPKTPFNLDRERAAATDTLAHRSRTAPHLARRAPIVLACVDGRDNAAVAKRLRLSPTTVCKWRARFVRDRLDGLYDEPRPDAPRTVTDDQVERVVVGTLETTPRGAMHWSTRGMAKATGLSHMTIARIWRAFGLQPHREPVRTDAGAAWLGSVTVCPNSLVSLRKRPQALLTRVLPTASKGSHNKILLTLMSSDARRPVVSTTRR